MKENVCHIVDRSLRAIVGLALLALLLTDSSYKWWGLIGLLPLATAILKYCPAYALLDLSTCPMPKKAE